MVRGVSRDTPLATITQTTQPASVAFAMRFAKRKLRSTTSIALTRNSKTVAIATSKASPISSDSECTIPMMLFANPCDVGIRAKARGHRDAGTSPFVFLHELRVLVGTGLNRLPREYFP